MDENNDKINDQEKYEELALEDVAYGTQHALNILLDLLIEKGVINEQEFKDKLDEMIAESESLDQVDLSDQINVQGPVEKDSE